MECWSDVLTRITPLLHYSITPARIIAEAWQAAPSVYGWLGLLRWLRAGNAFCAGAASAR
jgi:hypothetical protein